MLMVMGTSTCQLLMAHHERPVEGMAGVVEDGIVPGYYAYESGQAAVGDLFAWFAHHAVPPSYHEAASKEKLTVQELLMSDGRVIGLRGDKGLRAAPPALGGGRGLRPGGALPSPSPAPCFTV